MSFVVVVVFNFFHRKSIEEKTLVDIDIEKVRKRISWRKKKNEKSHFSNAEIIRWPVQMPAFLRMRTLGRCRSIFTRVLFCLAMFGH